MLGDITQAESVYIVTGATDMRKSIDGLCAIVQEKLKMDPSGSSLFLFCGKRKDRIKVLLKEKDGYVLLYKRLTGTGHYKWPKNSTEARELTWTQFTWLMQGLEIEQPRAIRGS